MMLFRIAVILALLTGSAQAQMWPFPGPGVSGTAGGGGYTGPCEVSGVSCVAFYAVEACATNAYSGNTVDVVDTATGNTTGTRLTCASGVVSAVVSGSACTFVTGNACSSLATTCATSCVPSTVYNQMGTGTFPDLTGPATLSVRLTISASSLNSKSCFAGNGAQYLTNNVTIPTLAQPMTLASVSVRTGSFTSTQSVIAEGNTLNMGYRATINTVGSISGTITQTASDSSFHSIQEVNASGAGNSFMVVDGSAGSTGTLTGAFSGANAAVYGAFTNAPASPITGKICEMLITNSAMNSTQAGNLSTNTRLSGRWGSY